jgi:hypothetical protein
MNKPTPLTVSAPVRRRPVVSTDKRRREEIRGEEKREGLSTESNSPSLSPLAEEVWQILRGGVDSLDLNDHGRPWPYPNRAAVTRLTAEFDHDLCIKAAREAREIVQSQDRAPNITALFEKKLRDHLAEVREAVRGALADVGEREPCR